MDGAGKCRDCKQSSAALRHAQSRITDLEAEVSALRELLEEKNRTTELLQADLKRYRYAYNVGQPNCPERVPKDQLQLAFCARASLLMGKHAGSLMVLMVAFRKGVA